MANNKKKKAVKKVEKAVRKAVKRGVTKMAVERALLRGMSVAAPKKPVGNAAAKSDEREAESA